MVPPRAVPTVAVVEALAAAAVAVPQLARIQVQLAVGVAVVQQAMQVVLAWAD